VSDDVLVEVYDAGWVRRGVIGAPSALEAVWRLNKSSTASITIRASHVKAWLLSTPGHRVRIVARGLTWSGWLDGWTFDGIGPAATLTARFLSDITQLERLLCWPAVGVLPGTLGAEYDRRSGPAETVLKQYVRAVKDRLDLPLWVPGTLKRGTTITEQLRMHTPADKLLPLMEAAGLRVWMLHLGRGDRHVTMDVDPIRTYPRTLSAASGVLGVDTTLTVQAPTVTRVVVGGAGDGTARLFRSSVDTAAESEWGTVGEKMIDARDVQLDLGDPQMDTQGEVDALMDARGAAALAEGAAQVSVSATLSETAWFRIAAGVLEVGDRVPLSITIPGGDPARPLSVEVTETITEATLSWTPDRGVRFAPKLGRMVDDPAGPVLVRLAQLSREVRRLNTL